MEKHTINENLKNMYHVFLHKNPISLKYHWILSKTCMYTDSVQDGMVSGSILFEDHLSLQKDVLQFFIQTLADCEQLKEDQRNKIEEKELGVTIERLKTWDNPSSFSRSDIKVDQIQFVIDKTKIKEVEAEIKRLIPEYIWIVWKKYLEAN